ncbi:hypothetical protein ACNKHS_24650 [Shigella flexneri]
MYRVTDWSYVNLSYERGNTLCLALPCACSS